MIKKKTNCDKCNKDVGRIRNLKKTNGGFFCKKCVLSRRKKHREFLKREIIGLTKEKELEEKREIQNKYQREKTKRIREEKEKNTLVKPKIKPIKQNRLKISALGLYITKIEKQVLWEKLKRKGLTSQESNKRIRSLCEKMSKVIKKLKEKVKTKEELNKRFKEEWAKLIEREELT